MKLLSLCFVKKENKILLIKRKNYPFIGMWNAIGGHKEDNETIDECAIREIKEESGIEVKNVKCFSKFTWNFDDDISYAYVCELDDSFDMSSFPKEVDEGIIDFKDIEWILDKKNKSVVPDLFLFIDDIKNNQNQNYHLVYDKDDNLIEIIKKA